MLSVYAEGRLYQNATTYGINVWGIIGIWLIFGLPIVITLFVILSKLFLTSRVHDEILWQVSDGESIEFSALGGMSHSIGEFVISFLITILLNVINIGVLWKATQRYRNPVSAGSMLAETRAADD